jgi:ribosomal-protein-alanine N-acetyltransferase
MNRFPILETERLVLHEFKESDAQAVFDIFSQDTVTRYHNLETMQSLEQAQKLVETRASLFQNKLGLRWAMALKDQRDIVIGSCGYYALNRAFHSVEIGYDLHPGHWGQGLMKETLGAVINLGFGNALFSFRLNRIVALTYLEHQASSGLLKRLSFQEEGILREYGYWKGQFHDLRCFSLLRRDWEARP